MTMIFGQLTEQPPGTFVIEDQVSVTVSPQQMKALVRAMGETLEAYENTFGTLSIQEDVTRPKFTAKDLIDRLASGRALISSPSPTEKSPPSRKSPGASRKKA